MHAVTSLSSDGAELSDLLFGQNKPFFIFFYICICEADNSYKAFFFFLLILKSFLLYF